MNTLMLVGHVASGVDAVERQLRACGMQAALPSQRYARIPTEITRTLCMAHHASDPCSVTGESGIHQIHPGRVWDGIALDLFLGNCGQHLWGWADPWSIYLLDYWKQVDPRITFILVYDGPASALAGTEDTPRDPARSIANWMAYNTTLLNFFRENPERCLLVHSEQVHRSLHDHVTQIRDRLPSTPDFLANTQLENDPALLPTAALLPASRIQAIEIPGEISGILDENTLSLWVKLQDNTAKKYISGKLLEQFPKCNQMYDELQSAASLPLRDTGSQTEEHPADAWSHIITQEQLIAKLLEEIQSRQGILEDEKQKALSEEQRLGTALDELLGLLPEMRSSGTDHRENEDGLAEKVASLSTRLRLTNALLAYTRRQLERAAADHSELEQTRNCLARQRNDLAQQCEDAARMQEELAQQYESARLQSMERVKMQLSYRLGNNLVKRAYNLGGWLGMPVSTFHIIRDFNRRKNGGPPRAT